jgi:hypothetical protein
MNLEHAKETPQEGGAGGCESEPKSTRPAPEEGAGELSAAARRVAWIRSRSLAAQKLASNIKKSDMEAMSSVNEFFLACALNDVLEDFDPQALKVTMDEKVEMFFKLASAVSSQVAERQSALKIELDFQKYRDQVKAQKEKITSAVTLAGTGGLSQEVLARIEEAVGLL